MLHNVFTNITVAQCNIVIIIIFSDEHWAPSCNFCTVSPITSTCMTSKWSSLCIPSMTHFTSIGFSPSVHIFMFLTLFWGSKRKFTELAFERSLICVNAKVLVFKYSKCESTTLTSQRTIDPLWYRLYITKRLFCWRILKYVFLVI